MLRAGLSPIQKQTKLVSYQIANRLCQAIAPFQHGGLVEGRLLENCYEDTNSRNESLQQ